MKQIPNLFTLLNLVFGCIAIIYILQTGQTIAEVDNKGIISPVLPEKIALGALFIFLAGVVDFLDGFLARMLKADSAMGKQLDSLADVVSFGVAPGLILYQLLRIGYAGSETSLDTSIIWLLPSLLIPCAAAWRLAKFNIDESQQFHFKGLPTPAAGLTIASFPLIVWHEILNLQSFFINKLLLYAVIIILSLLMVSNLPLMALKFKDFSVKNNLSKYLLLVIGIIAAVLVQWLAVPVVLIAYILVSVFQKK